MWSWFFYQFYPSLSKLLLYSGFRIQLRSSFLQSTPKENLRNSPWCIRHEPICTIPESVFLPLFPRGDHKVLTKCLAISVSDWLHHWKTSCIFSFIKKKKIAFNTCHVQTLFLVVKTRSRICPCFPTAQGRETVIRESDNWMENSTCHKHYQEGVRGTTKSLRDLS